jgi:hypothetical protein
MKEGSHGPEDRLYQAAVTGAHPELRPWVCTGDHSPWLQETEGEVMIGVLEALAESGVVALPLHDSVIAPRRSLELAGRVMRETYMRRTGFDITVR